ncbi:MAG: polyprenyl synthetase family protein, partial [Pseudomonadota bacterium]|nr:polyprenyl synthetase family protein [Pseudomonadota bacterium]
RALAYQSVPKRPRPVAARFTARPSPHRCTILSLVSFVFLNIALGIAFQIADDLLDYQGDTAQTGKNVGDDFRERKLTLPVIKAVAQATDEERSFWERTIEKGRQEDGDLDHALALMDKYNTLSRTRDDALAWAEKAKDAVKKLPDYEIRGLLSDIADYVVARLN